MAYEQIIYEVADNIATITLNRPEKLNAFTGIMMTEMIDAFDKVDADDNVRAVIVTGAGRAFCAGADLSAGPRTFDSTREDRADRRAAIRPDGTVDWSNEAVRDGGGRLTLRIFECKKPVIAAVNGAAVGVGVTMQLGDGCAARVGERALRLRVRAARNCAGGVLELVSAESRGHLAGAGVDLHRPRFSG